jgi:5-hydroxyisourate hydrolase-like protein (transthyretin family)
MPDPRTMSGISRVDPGLASGQVTVRCLNGTFAQPAVGLAVTLKVTGPDGAQSEFKVDTVAEGRATFTGLGAFVGGQAVASAEFDGELVSSRPIPLAASGGSRLLLVRGASNGPTPSADASAPSAPNAHGGNPHAQGGGTDGLPPFGEAFPLTGRPAGTVVVGTLAYREATDEGGQDTPSGGIEPLTKLPVKLYAVAEGATDLEGARVLAEKATDEEGRVSFQGLEVGEGERVVAEAQVSPDAAAQRSKPFDISEVAMAVVLVDETVAATIAEQQARAQQGHAAAAGQGVGPRRRAPLPPVSRDANTPANAVRVAIIDGEDRPVADKAVVVHRVSPGGGEVTAEGSTGPNGVALVDELQPKTDALFYAEVDHEGAPYRTRLFELPEKVGARATLRVFPRTTDPKQVRSAVHFEFDGLENDKLRLLIGYEVLVQGDAAFWPDGGMKLAGPEAVTVAKPMPEAGAWLEEVEGAPFAKLTGPLPPGEVIKLSMAYVLPHAGTAKIEWEAPFPLMQARAVLKTEQSISSGTTGAPGERVDAEHAVGEPLIIHDLAVAGGSEAAPGTSLAFTIDGFVSRPRYYWYVAIGAGVLIVLVAGFAVATAPRKTRREELVERRDLLHRRFDELSRGSATEAELDKVKTALELVYRQLDALDAGGGEGART